MRTTFASGIVLQGVMASQVEKKDSAPDKRIPLEVLCLWPTKVRPPHSDEAVGPAAVLTEIGGYRLKRVSSIPNKGGKPYFGPNGGGIWFTKFPDYASLRKSAIATVARGLRKGPPFGESLGGEVLFIEDYAGVGISVTMWTAEDFLATERWQPTEAIFKPYSLVGGKLCWGEELRGQEAIEFVTSLLQVELPKPRQALQVSL